MNRLNDQYSARVDFFHLDFDQPETKRLMQRFNVRDRSTYIVLDANGREVARWLGPLDEAIVGSVLAAQP